MIYLQRIFADAINRIATGSTVANITLITSNNWTFTTTDLKNISVDLDVIIGNFRYTVTAITGKKVSIYGLNEPTANSWTLALSFRYGHTIEINNILAEAKQMDSENIKRFPFIWLMLNNENKPLPNFGIEAYETECKIAFVNVAQINAQAPARLTNNFEKILDKIFDLFFAELNTLPTAANFNIKTSEPIRPTFVDRFYYGSADKKLNVFPDAQTDAIECKFDLQVVPVSNCNYTGLKPELVPVFSLVDSGTDAEAFTDEPFTLRKTLNNLTVDTRPVNYSLLFDFGVLGTELRTGTLQYGESVYIEITKTLTGITGAYTINISGSEVLSVDIYVNFYALFAKYDYVSSISVPLKYGFTGAGQLTARRIIDLNTYLFTNLATKSILMLAGVNFFEVFEPLRVTRFESTSVIYEMYLAEFENIVYIDCINAFITNTNKILADLVSNGKTSGYLRISGGANVAPTGQGLTDKATLQSRGWTVLTN